MLKPRYEPLRVLLSPLWRVSQVRDHEKGSENPAAKYPRTNPIQSVSYVRRKLLSLKQRLRIGLSGMTAHPLSHVYLLRTNTTKSPQFLRLQAVMAEQDPTCSPSSPTIFHRQIIDGSGGGNAGSRTSARMLTHSGRIVVCCAGLCSSPASFAIALEHPIPALHVYPTFKYNTHQMKVRQPIQDGIFFIGDVFRITSVTTLLSIRILKASAPGKISLLEAIASCVHRDTQQKN